LNSSIQTDADTLLTRSIIYGQTDSGDFHSVPVTQEGHLEVSLHDPVLPFGSVHTESLTPVFQFDGVYQANPGQVLATTSGSGTATTTNGMLTATTGTTIYSQGIFTSRKRLRYRAGQGIVGRFTAKFTAPVDNSYQLVGFGHAEAGVYVGYGNTSDLTDNRLGILHVTGGLREIKTLTVTTKATAAGNVTVTLNGTAYTVAVTDATAGTLQQTVWDISRGTYAGWDAYPTGATVVFVRKSAGTTAGTQSFAAGATGSAATIAQTRAGAASTDTFYPQDEWNGDKLDGTGASGVTIIPTNLNIFQISVGYLGTDAVVVKCKVPSSGGNNATWVTVNTINFPNSRTTPTFSNPSFPFTMAAYSAGSTTNLTVQSASVAGMIEGAKVLHGNRFSYFNAITTANATNFTALLTVMNARVYSGIVNQAVINLMSVSGAVKHTQPVVFYLYKNANLAGNPNFQALASNSCSVYDTAATTITGGELLWSGHLGETGDIDHHFGNGGLTMEELTLQPGEWVTLAVKAVQNNPAWVTGAINTREDQ
jgi:hypothetical protein